MFIDVGVDGVQHAGYIVGEEGGVVKVCFKTVKFHQFERVDVLVGKVQMIDLSYYLLCLFIKDHRFNSKIAAHSQHKEDIYGYNGSFAMIF